MNAYKWKTNLNIATGINNLIFVLNAYKWKTNLNITTGINKKENLKHIVHNFSQLWRGLKMLLEFLAHILKRN